MSALKPTEYLDVVQVYAKKNYPAMRLSTSLAPYNKDGYLKLSVFDLESSLGLLFEVRVDAMNNGNAAKDVDSVALLINERRGDYYE